jgi:hypothetical protein
VAATDSTSSDLKAINPAELLAFEMYTRGGSQGLILTAYRVRVLTAAQAEVLSVEALLYTTRRRPSCDDLRAYPSMPSAGLNCRVFHILADQQALTHPLGVTRARSHRLRLPPPAPRPPPRPPTSATTAHWGARCTVRTCFVRAPFSPNVLG